MTPNAQTNKHDEPADAKLDELLDKVAEATLDADLPPQWCLDNQNRLVRFAAALLEADAQRVSASKHRMKQLSSVLGNPLTVEALEGDSVEDALIELACARLEADARRPAMRPLTDAQILEAIRHLYQDDIIARMAIEVSIDDYRAIEAAHGITGEKA